jgi:hypothetical protein
MNYYGIFQLIGEYASLVEAGMNLVTARQRARILNACGTGMSKFIVLPYSI